MAKTLKKEVPEVKEKKYPTISHGSLTLLNTNTVRTHNINGSINNDTLKNFQKFLAEIFESNAKIDSDAEEAKEKAEFKKIHDPEAKPEFTVTKKKVERINLVLNSGGGSVDVMLEIVSLMKMSSIPIDTYCFGSAMSAAFFIFIHGKRRFVGEGVSIMTHSISSMAWDNVPNMKIYVEYLNTKNEYAQQEIAKRTGISLEKLKEKEHVDWFMGAEEVLDLKIAEYLIKD